MGFAPPLDAPSPEEQDVASLDAGFEASPTGPSICGFGIPLFVLSLTFRIPKLPIPTLPTFDYFIQLNCDLSDPIDAEFGFGGGRVGSSDVDTDDELKAA